MDLLNIVVIFTLNVVFNLLLEARFKCKHKKKYVVLLDNLSEDEKALKKAIGKSNGFSPVNYVVRGIFKFSNYIDFIYNASRFIHFGNEKDKKNIDKEFHIYWDRIVFAYMVTAICFYWFTQKNSIIVAYLFWRIVVITAAKLREVIVHFAGGRDFHSIVRTYVLTGFSFFELIFAYSYIYTYYGFNAGKFQTFEFALSVFPTIKEFQPCEVHVLALSQWVVMTIFASIFFTNIFSIKKTSMKK